MTVQSARVWPSIVSGVGLLVLSLLLFGVAWVMFDKGKPGAPEFADAQVDYGVDPGVQIYLPSAFDPTKVATTVYFKETKDGTREDIKVDVIGDALKRQRITIVIELREAARFIPADLAHSSTDDETVTAVSRNGNQYIIATLDGRGRLGVEGLQVSGRMQIPALNTENSRTSFASPKFGSVRFCDFLQTSPPATQQTPIDVENFADPYPCDSNSARNRGRSLTDLAKNPPFKAPVALEIEGYLRRATRLDFYSPSPPSNEGTNLRWSTDDSDGEFRVRASYVDIGEEANVQRYLFISGVVVGLAAAIAPIAWPLVANAFRTRRQLRAAGEHETAPPETTPPETTPPDETNPGETTPPDETNPGETTPPDETNPGETTPARRNHATRDRRNDPEAS
jgi:hypothetical protein